MRRVICLSVFIVLTVATLGFAPKAVKAENRDGIAVFIEQLVNWARSPEVKIPVVSAKNAVVVDCADGRILFGKNIQEPVPIASITKLMTAIVFLEHNPGWDIRYVIDKEDWRSSRYDWKNDRWFDFDAGDSV